MARLEHKVRSTTGCYDIIFSITLTVFIMIIQMRHCIYIFKPAYSMPNKGFPNALKYYWSHLFLIVMKWRFFPHEFIGLSVHISKYTDMASLDNSWKTYNNTWSTVRQLPPQTKTVVNGVLYTVYAKVIFVSQHQCQVLKIWNIIIWNILPKPVLFPVNFIYHGTI
jgi:hypothetical protein